MPPASVVINYCSNEKAFLDAAVGQALLFSDDVVVSYGSCLYDGTPEDLQHIADARARFPSVQFVEYTVDTSVDMSRQRGVVRRAKAYWCNLARWTGIQALRRRGWVFIVDVDEVFEGALVRAWLQHAELREDECYKVANYWYFKDVTNQATTLEDSVLLIHAKHLTEATVFGDNERDHTIPASGTKLQTLVRGRDGEVLAHHFSWCRSPSSLTHKIRNWSHSDDIFKGVDVQPLVDHIFRDANVNDVVHGYKYITVDNKFGIRL